VAVNVTDADWERSFVRYAREHDPSALRRPWWTRILARVRRFLPWA
jgi:hypothetical protein